MLYYASNLSFYCVCVILIEFFTIVFFIFKYGSKLNPIKLNQLNINYFKRVIKIKPPKIFILDMIVIFYLRFLFWI